MSDDFYARTDATLRRHRRRRVLTAEAQEILGAMADPLPEPGDEITIRWPKGPHDFTMIFGYEDTHMAAAPGWHYLHGVIVEPTNWHPRVWSPMVHLVDGEWSLAPKGGKLSDT